MLTPTCSKCGRMISGTDINVAQDVAYCRPCNISYRLSDLTSGADVSAQVNLQNPPAGAWFVNDGNGMVMGATNRSLASGLGLLFFAVFWNSIVSLFIFLVVSATLHHLGVTLPAWFPEPKMNGGEMSVGMTLGMWLFLTPFILVGTGVAIAALSSIFGRTEVRLANSEGTIFTGIGRIGWKRRFEISQIKTVRTHQQRNNEGRDSFAILLETHAGKQFKLGSLLTNERRQFLLGALQKTLLK